MTSLSLRLPLSTAGELKSRITLESISEVLDTKSPTETEANSGGSLAGR